MKKKIKLFILILLILGIGGLFYLMGYLPILGKSIAEKKLNDYLTHKEGKVQNFESSYNWYNAEYILKEKNNIKYKLFKDMIIDEEFLLAEDLKAREGYNKVRSEFPKNLEFPSMITVFTGINGSDYSIKGQRLYLLGVYNSENISEEESFKMPASISEKFIELMGEDYNITAIQVIYFDKNGGYESVISLSDFEEIEYDEILSNTKKMKDLPEEYYKRINKKGEL